MASVLKFHHLTQNDLNELSHEYYGRGSAFDVWQIIGVIIGLLLLCTIIGFIINCVRNGGFGTTYGQGYGQTYGVGQVHY